MAEQMDFADGKYTVINNNGILTALRHGEPWCRDLVGDNLVAAMLNKALELHQQREELAKALQAYVDNDQVDAHLNPRKRMALEVIAKVGT